MPLTCLCLSLGRDPGWGAALLSSVSLKIGPGQEIRPPPAWSQAPIPEPTYYLVEAMLPITMTAPMMPIRLYFGTGLDSCLRNTMCMSSWGVGSQAERGTQLGTVQRVLTQTQVHFLTWMWLLWSFPKASELNA